MDGNYLKSLKFNYHCLFISNFSHNLFYLSLAIICFSRRKQRLFRVATLKKIEINFIFLTRLLLSLR